jgi:hypothetical protein
MLIPSIMMYVTIKKGSATSTIKRPKTKTSTQPKSTNKPETEEEKYKNINDSIIK